MNDDLAPRLSPFQRRFVIAVFALIVAVLGANPMADMIGVDPWGQPYYETHLAKRVVCGILAGIVSLAAMIVLAYTVRLVVAALSRVACKPPLPIAITLLVCGVLCLLASLWFGWRIAHPSEETVASIAVHANVSSGSASIRLHAPLMSQVIAVGTFLAGAALAAIGVWSSIPLANTQAVEESAGVPVSAGEG